MTVTSSTTRVSYPGAGSTGPFSFSFRILAATDLSVLTRDDTTGAETDLTYPTDYSVSGVGNAAGGSITLTTAIEAGTTLVIRRVRALTQTTSVRNQGSYFGETHETAWDKLAMVDQQQQDEIDRSAKLSEGIDPADVDPTLPQVSAGSAIGWNGDGTGLTNLDTTPITSLGALPTAGDADLTTTAVTLLFSNSVSKALGLSRLAGYLARTFFGTYVVTDPKYGAVGDGTTDSKAAINAAITAANAAGGGVVLVPTSSSQFMISGGITLLSNVTLRGMGKGAAGLKRTAGGTSTTVIFAQNATNIAIENLKIDGQQATQSGSPATVAVAFDGCSKVTVRGCRLDNMKTGIWINTSSDASSNVRILDNDFGTIVDYGVRCNNASISNVTIRGNTFESIVRGALQTPSAVMSNASNVQIVNNTVLASDDSAFCISGTTAFNTLVQGNHCRTTLVCVYVGSGARYARVIGNDLASTSDFGVNVYNETGTSAEDELDLVVAGNVIHDCGKSGVDIEGVSSVAVTGNVIMRVGTVTASADNQRCGISITGGFGSYAPSRISVIGNTVQDNAGVPTMRYGILQQVAVTGLTILGNQVTGAIVANYDVSVGQTAPYLIQTDTTFYSDTTFYAKSVHGSSQTLTFGGTVSTDAKNGELCLLTVTSGAAFTIANPTNGRGGRRLTYKIINTSGGAMGAITWGANFRLAGAFTNPANNQARTITFVYDGSLWYELNRSAADMSL